MHRQRLPLNRRWAIVPYDSYNSSWGVEQICICRKIGSKEPLKKTKIDHRDIDPRNRRPPPAKREGP